MSANPFFSSPELLSEEAVHSLLKPLQQGNNSPTDYAIQYKAIMEFSRRLQSLEKLYVDVYSRASALEKEIIKQKIDLSSISSTNTRNK